LRLRKESYKVKKDIAIACAELLDFLSRIYGSYEQGTGFELVFICIEDLKAWQAYCDTIESLLKANEDFSLFTTQRIREGKIELENLSSRLTFPKDHEILRRIAEIYTEEIVPFNQEFAEIDWDNVCTEVVMLSLEKISENKRKLERISPKLDAMEKKWGEEIPDLLRQMLLSPYLSDLYRRKIEDFNQSVVSLEKQLVSTRKKYTQEYIKILNFLSLRYGTYKIHNNGVGFLYEIENKLCKSYLTNLKKFSKEEQDIALQIDKHLQRLFKRTFHLNSIVSQKYNTREKLN